MAQVCLYVAVLRLVKIFFCVFFTFFFFFFFGDNLKKDSSREMFRKSDFQLEGGFCSLAFLNVNWPPVGLGGDCLQQDFFLVSSFGCYKDKDNFELLMFATFFCISVHLLFCSSHLSCCLR